MHSHLSIDFICNLKLVCSPQCLSDGTASVLQSPHYVTIAFFFFWEKTPQKLLLLKSSLFILLFWSVWPSSDILSSITTCLYTVYTCRSRGLWFSRAWLWLCVITCCRADFNELIDSIDWAWACLCMNQAGLGHISALGVVKSFFTKWRSWVIEIKWMQVTVCTSKN